MTTKKNLKRRVRSRAAQTGEPYATALRRVRQLEENRMSTTPTEDVVVSCSFCGKSSTEVQRLVAGPGVYICNECVELSAEVLADAARATPEEASLRRSQHRDRSTEDILAMLPALVGSADRVEAELAGWINRLRARDIDWPTIANAAGTSVEAARQRFGVAPGSLG